MAHERVARCAHRPHHHRLDHWFGRGSLGSPLDHKVRARAPAQVVTRYEHLDRAKRFEGHGSSQVGLNEFALGVVRSASAASYRRLRTTRSVAMQPARTNTRTAIASRVRWRNVIGDHSFPWGARHVGRPDLDVPSPPARRDACALIERSFVFSSADTTTARQDRPETGPGCLGSTARSLADRADRAAFCLSSEASDGSSRSMMCSVMP